LAKKIDEKDKGLNTAGIVAICICLVIGLGLLFRWLFKIYNNRMEVK